MSINWGVFDFAAPNFAYRFIKGETDYMIGVAPFRYLIAEYNHERRSMTEQYLNLDSLQTSTLINLINDNLKPENQVYRYNYARDNCATRPLAIVEKALNADGCSIKINLPASETTFREELRRYHIKFPAYQLFIDYALGSGLDQPITPREQAFAPIFLETLVENSVIVAPDGSERPLAGKPNIILGGSSEPFTEGGLPAWMVIVGIGICVVAFTWRDQRRRHVTRWFDGVFYAVLGLLGLLLAFLIFVSSHEATSPNVNFIWINPLCFVVPFFIAFKRGQKIVFFYQIANFAALIIFLGGMPFFNQSSNWMIIAMAIFDLIRSANYISITRESINSQNHPAKTN